MTDSLGIAFAPTADNALDAPRRAGIEGLPQAIRVLSLRLPRVVGARSIAPNALMQGGGAQSTASGIDPYLSAVMQTMAANLVPTLYPDSGAPPTMYPDGGATALPPKPSMPAPHVTPGVSTLPEQAPAPNVIPGQFAPAGWNEPQLPRAYTGPATINERRTIGKWDAPNYSDGWLKPY